MHYSPVSSFLPINYRSIRSDPSSPTPTELTCTYARTMGMDITIAELVTGLSPVTTPVTTTAEMEIDPSPVTITVTDPLVETHELTDRQLSQGLHLARTHQLTDRPPSQAPLAGTHEPADCPPSPWGTRYGLHSQTPSPFMPTNNSWISPSLPAFGPKAATTPSTFPNTLSTRPTLKNGIPAPNPLEADRLFTTERIQQQRFAGLRTWEASLLQDVKGYEGGNELVQGCMISKRLVVGEEAWYPVFRKNRWIDYNVKVGESGVVCPRELGGKDAVWSVDNEAVWGELRPCVELANRILRQAVRGPWYVALLSLLVYSPPRPLPFPYLLSARLIRETFPHRLSSLLDSSAHETSHGVRYTMTPETGEISDPTPSSIRRFVQVDPSRRLAPATVDDMLKTTDHLISWSFFSPEDERATPEPFRGQSICIVDCQAIEQSGRSQVTISLDVSLLKPLLSWKLNVTDKAVIQHTIGVNVGCMFLFVSLRGC